MLFFLHPCTVDKCAAVLRLACKKHKLIPLRMYSEITMCADECLLCVCVCVCASGSGCQPGSNKKSWHDNRFAYAHSGSQHSLEGTRIKTPLCFSIEC